MTTFDIHAAKIHLASLIERAAAGEEIIIAIAGRSRARLVALPRQTEPKTRTLGHLAGRLSIPDDFDAPLPGSDLDTFETQSSAKTEALKALLAEAPLEGIDLTRAAETLLDRQRFELDLERGKAFQAALDAPPRPLPLLDKLLRDADAINRGRK